MNLSLAGITTHDLSHPVDLDILLANVQKSGKRSRTFRAEERLLLQTEELREEVNLNFSNYVETALVFFNSTLIKHMNQKKEADCQ